MQNSAVDEGFRYHEPGLVTDNQSGSQDTATALDTLLVDLESGADPADLRTPPGYRLSSISLSDTLHIPLQLVTPPPTNRANRLTAVVDSASGLDTSMDHIDEAFSPEDFSKDLNQSASQHHHFISRFSGYSSSVYSERSSVLVAHSISETKATSLDDSILTPRPVCFHPQTRNRFAEEASAFIHGHSFLIDDSSDESGSSSPTITAKERQSERKRLIDQSETGSPHDLLKHIGRYPMVSHSPKRRFNAISTSPLPITINEKAARILGLDGAGSLSASPKTPTTPVFSGAFKDLTNSATGSFSPKSLRNIASRLSLVSRKKSPRHVDAAMVADTIAEASDEVSNASLTLRTSLSSSISEPWPDPFKASDSSGLHIMQHIEEEDNGFEANLAKLQSKPFTPVDSLSNRRGFRPLSVHTGYVFDPFGIENGLPPGSSAAADKNHECPIVEDDFSTLVSTPAPDLDDHPMFQHYPFSATSTNPLLKTTSTPAEIRSLATGLTPKAPKTEDGLPSDSRTNDSASQKDIWSDGNSELLHHETPRTPTSHLGGGPLSKETDFAKTLTVDPETSKRPSTSTKEGSDYGVDLGKPETTPKLHSIKNAFRSAATPMTPPSPYPEEELAARVRKTSVKSTNESGEQRRSRGFSSFLKSFDKPKSEKSGISTQTHSLGFPNSSLEKKSSKIASDGEQNFNKVGERESEIANLRRAFNALSPDYTSGDAFPRHPTTARSWHAKNLKCTTCVGHLCQSCGRTCCEYKRAYLAAENRHTSEANRQDALDRMSRINEFFPYGKESPTFIQCTHGGGCGRMVCPDCIGQCPLSFCQDTQCKRCKKEPWAICDFHTEDEIRFNRNRGLTGSVRAV